MNRNVALATTLRTVSDSFIFNNAVQDLALGENTAAGLRGLFPGLAPRTSCPIRSRAVSAQKSHTVISSRTKNKALTVTGICSVLLRLCLFSEMSLTGDRLQGSPRLRISRLNVPQGLVKTRSRALKRGAISQTHCNQHRLQQLLVTN